MVLLLEAVRAELGAYASKHALGYHFYPPITAPAGSSHYGKLPLANLGSKVDYTNLMTDDYAGSWSPAAGHNADVYANADRPQSTAFNTDGAVKAYLHAGVPAHKLVLGMPVYDRSFLGASDMGEPYSGVGLANKVMGSWADGVIDVEREAELGKAIHSKGVMLLTGYLGNKYAQHFSLTLSANIAIEQSYGYITKLIFGQK